MPKLNKDILFLIFEELREDSKSLFSCLMVNRLWCETVISILDIGSIKHQIFYFPEAKARLESLCELKCDTSIDSSYFYGLVRICQYIQRLIIINKYLKVNHGMVKLIEIQRNLKYFEWKDDFE